MNDQKQHIISESQKYKKDIRINKINKIKDMNDKNLLHKITNQNKYLYNKFKNVTNYEITNSNTLIILDWDDTLFPTSWASKYNINISNSKTRILYEDFFKDLDNILFTFLTNLIKQGTIYIITNATSEWVKISSIILVKTYNFINNNKIQIISARTLYEKKHAPSEWKKHAFKDVILKEFKNANIMNVISVGDSEYEHNALIEMSKIYTDKIKFLKSFKLMLNPNYNTIVDELSVLNNIHPEIWHSYKQICKTFVQI